MHVMIIFILFCLFIFIFILFFICLFYLFIYLSILFTYLIENCLNCSGFKYAHDPLIECWNYIIWSLNFFSFFSFKSCFISLPDMIFI